MSEVLVGVLGAVLVLVVLVDALTTTVTVSGGAGPLTRHVTGVMWRVLLRVHRRDIESSPLAVAGPVLLIVTVLVWVALLWAGWALVLLSFDSVVNATTRTPAGVADVVYYAGFTVFTLGVGDFVATTSVTRVLTAISSFTGLFVITLAITYLISVVSAVVARRALAVQIATLGSDPADMVAGGWDGDQFSSAFVQQLVNLTGALATSAEQHLAYPVLHYFHSSTRVAAAPVAVAHLDEALFLLQEAVAAGAAPAAGTVAPTRRAVDRYLHTVGATAKMPIHVEDPPPAPDLAGLRGAGIPVTGDADFERAVTAAADRRRTMATMVANDGWSW